MKHSTITILISDETPMADLDQLFLAIADIGLAVHQIAPGQTLAAPREWRVEKKVKRNPAAKIRAAADKAISDRVIH
jgi:hypothetical protein